MANNEFVYIEGLGLNINPGTRRILLDGGEVVTLTEREMQILKARAAGITEVNETLKYISDLDRMQGMNLAEDQLAMGENGLRATESRLRKKISALRLPYRHNKDR